MPSSAAASTDAPFRTLSVRLPAHEYAALADLAWRERTSASQLSRDAIRARYPEVARVASDSTTAAA